MKTETRKCSNCHYWRDVFRGERGVCGAKVPTSYVGIYWQRKVSADAVGCPAHRMRSSRKVAASHQAQVGGEA
jgi:hypothetical protein